MTRHPGLAVALLTVVIATAAVSRAEDEPDSSQVAETLRKLDVRVVPADSERAKELPRMLGRDARARIDAANRRETEAWHKITNRDEWERYRDQRIEALRRSLGQFPDPPKDLKMRVTRTLDGDGYQIQNVVFESRPGVHVTANLYVPAKPTKAMPGILIVHSHHNPKTQGELQDMGMTWARQGCLVLVMDQLGHGERRQHPFVTEKDYAGTFRPSRQDYYFRYNVGMQLHLLGDGLIGWMVWDLRRGIDLLLAQPGIDKEKIILLGSVAAGGEPVAVTAALDRRVAAVAPFNFGGPQPESTFPLPEDENRFNYAGSGSWESTRNLRLSARDSFLPWVIVGSAAPRGLIYAHEFAWDRDHDPVWKRLETICSFYDAKDRLAFTKGRGAVTGKAGSENTHCNNIGPVHRQGIYPALKKWFDMPIPEKEYQERHKADELLCLTPEVLKEVKPRPLYQVAGEIGEARAAAARKKLADLKPDERRKRLREEWAKLLGDVEPREPKRLSVAGGGGLGRGMKFQILLEVEPQVVLPLFLWIAPEIKVKDRPRSLVVFVCQEGKAEFLKSRADAVATLLEGGVTVCLVDVRGTGETRPGDGRGRQSTATSISSTELMLGQTLLGSRLRDLRTVLKYLRGREDIGAKCIALWGDSLAPANPADRDLKVPLDADKQPDLAEPLGGLLALFGALYEDDVKAVYVRGGLDGYQSVLKSQFVYVPHDIIIPGALTAGDLCDVAAALAPRPLRLEGLVDGLNRRVKTEALAKTYEPATTAYREAKAEGKLQLADETSSAAAAAKWLLDNLKK
ncbi:MAG TPA: acetylxylan esterase [Gemmataceae bacterium]|nr:acetylxylan esterase [Gemmataceae bacterium]